ncbi:MAG: ROK family protein [Myxococcales bacterium]|jgi:glucokinase|nr:ROK family protein [Myxococcales bacterium]MBL0195854.1 ROK family protein [Myxococcales bacterium]HQY63200.1 ROK family protein [Polyangiaceae bacterium]
MSVLSVDLGGTRMRGAVLDEDGALLHRDVRPTPVADAEPAGLVDLMRELVRHGSRPARAIVGVPGRVDHREGRLDRAPNLPPSWAPHLTEAALGAAIGVPVRLVNDADLAAVGEAYFGAGRGFSDVAYVTLSTGVGGGVLLGRRLLVGRRSLAEVGHMVIDRGAHARGEPSTFEQLASGRALARVAEAHGLALTGREVVERARANDAAALAVLGEICTAAAIGVRDVAFAFSPEIVVIGGGLGLNDDLLHPAIRAHLDAEGPPAMRVELARATLGDDAGLIGAAALERALAGGP